MPNSTETTNWALTFTFLLTYSLDNAQQYGNNELGSVDADLDVDVHRTNGLTCRLMTGGIVDGTMGSWNALPSLPAHDDDDTTQLVPLTNCCLPD
ncbi:hypothetical protein K435DRAFT_859203 [Dendrothele bispora CBS 962.96]|uniref:Uncharacterized protein n=1 Tax=Dendrothele bispora (strain CBS 962.96) TaxID=1314807 RepID=A0A4S8M1H7_DENBC|nr:hypothetical protein K435DRAFT_859203 [Dendrothele bispora CBS 962.96]